MASVDVELKVLCLQSRAAEEASERAKQEKLAAAAYAAAHTTSCMKNYVLAEKKYILARAEAEKAAAQAAASAAQAAASRSEVAARRAEAQALRLAYVQKYGEYISDDET